MNRGEAGRFSSKAKAAVGWFGSGGGEEHGVMASSSSVKELRRAVMERRLGTAGRCGVGMTMCAIV